MFWTLLLQSLPAFPCAAMVTEYGEFASSDAQEVILSRTDAGSTVSYRITYEGDAKEFGWIIVVPGTVSEVNEGDENRFDRLREATNPIIYYRDASKGGGGCGCADSKMDKAGGGEFGSDTAGVNILSEGFAGPYEYTALEASDDSALIDWLESHDFDPGGTATTLAEYVSEGGYTFVAVKLTADEPVTPDGGSTLPPLAISTDATTLSFPARMALTGAPEVVRTTVWVTGDSPATLTAGWTSTDLTWLDSEYEDASQFFEDHIQELATAEPAYARIYVGQVDGEYGEWVTRFDTNAARAVHTADPVFDLGAPKTRLHLQIQAEYPWLAWLLFPVATLGWGLRRRYQSDST